MELCFSRQVERIRVIKARQGSSGEKGSALAKRIAEIFIYLLI